ncbi:MAG: cation:proton antiporter, partial [Nitrososphaerales archaeon]
MELKISRLSREIPRVLIQVNAYVLSGIFAVAALTMLLLHWDIWSSLLMGSIVGGGNYRRCCGPVDKGCENERGDKDVSRPRINAQQHLFGCFLPCFLRVVQGASLGVGGILSGIGIAVLAGLLCGLGLGYLWRWLSAKLTEFDFRYVLVLVFVFVAYLISDSFGGGGLVSSLIFGFVAFRSGAPRKKSQKPGEKAEIKAPANLASTQSSTSAGSTI